MRPGELPVQFGGEAFHLLGKCFVVFFDFFTADVAAGCEDVVVLFDFIKGRDFGKAGHILVFAILGFEVMVGGGDAGDVFWGEFAVAASNHLAEVAAVDEECFATAVGAVARHEPQASWNAGVEEQLAW